MLPIHENREPRGNSQETIAAFFLILFVYIKYKKLSRIFQV